MGLLDRIRKAGAPATPEEADRLAVRQLAGRGADLARPRHIVHYLYLRDEERAREVAGRVGQAGYETTVAPPGEAVAVWSVRAEGVRVVDATTVAAFRRWFEQIAAEADGEYDGWEAPAEP